MEIAGTFWMIPEVRFVRDFRGHQAIAAKDMLQYQTAVANHICAEDTELTLAEFELLCSLSGMTATDVAKTLHIDKSTVSKWRALNGEEENREALKKKTIPYVYSKVLKLVVWDRIFADIDRRSDAKKRRDWYSAKKHLPKIVAA